MAGITVQLRDKDFNWYGDIYNYMYHDNQDNQVDELAGLPTFELFEMCEDKL